jgi:hypothetical protein
MTREDGLRAPGALDELITGVEPVVGIQARVVVALQAILHGNGKLACDEYSRFHARRVRRLLNSEGNSGDSLRDFALGPDAKQTAAR